MNQARVDREQIAKLTDLPNVGPAMARDFRRLGFDSPEKLGGADPLVLYRALCEVTARRQDPCVLDVFISVIHFLDGGEAKPWWHFTERRKREHPHI